MSEYVTTADLRAWNPFAERRAKKKQSKPKSPKPLKVVEHEDGRNTNTTNKASLAQQAARQRDMEAAIPVVERVLGELSKYHDYLFTTNKRLPTRRRAWELLIAGCSELKSIKTRTFMTAVRDVFDRHSKGRRYSLPDWRFVNEEVEKWK